MTRRLLTAIALVWAAAVGMPSHAAEGGDPARDVRWELCKPGDMTCIQARHAETEKVLTRVDLADNTRAASPTERQRRAEAARKRAEDAKRKAEEERAAFKAEILAAAKETADAAIKDALTAKDAEWVRKFQEQDAAIRGLQAQLARQDDARMFKIGLAGLLVGITLVIVVAWGARNIKAILKAMSANLARLVATQEHTAAHPDPAPPSPDPQRRGNGASIEDVPLNKPPRESGEPRSVTLPPAPHHREDPPRGDSADSLSANLAFAPDSAAVPGDAKPMPTEADFADLDRRINRHRKAEVPPAA